MKRLLGPALILLCTIIWGTAFLAQKTGSAHYGPFTLTCFRNILAGLFLGSVVLVRGGRLTRIELAGGAVSGVALFAAMAAQQLGIEHTTPGVSAFLTANYIVFLPSEADRLTLAHFTAGWWSLFYLGVMSSGIAYTLQNFGQALTAAPVAALIMSFESVVGAASGWIAFGDALSARQLVGCALVFAAILLAQFAPSALQGEQQ